MTCSLDFETRSVVDLRKSGMYVYAEHPTTDVLCLAFKFEGDDVVGLWTPHMHDTPADLIEHIRRGGELRAWNAAFERTIWRRFMVYYGFPSVKNRQWVCTAAEAANMGLPRKLEEAAKALDSKFQKDMAGHRLMLQVSKPRKIEDDGTIVWWQDADKLERVYAYCQDDVRTEMAIAEQVQRLSDRERMLYLLDQLINDRGMQLNLSKVKHAQEHVAELEAQGLVELKEITGGKVKTPKQVQAFKQWLEEQGCPLPDLTKATVAQALKIAKGPAHKALLIRQDHSRSSTAKLDAMERACCADQRVRGMLMYYGANRTGRWSGRLIQPQNIPPGEVNGVDLRSMLVASPGHRLMIGDYGQIEARILCWLAGEQYRANEYEQMASAIFGVPVEQVTKDQRFVGKVATLLLGFGGGAKKFAESAGVEFELAQRAVNTYRSSKPGIPGFWRAAESAARQAINSGRVSYAGVGAQVRYSLHHRGYLRGDLPSGRSLFYSTPEIDDGGLSYMGVGLGGKWMRERTYGGKLVENIVQATARDVLASAMLRLERAGYPVVLTVHDEIVCDVPMSRGSLAEFEAIMTQRPSWLGCHVPVKAVESPHYLKN